MAFEALFTSVISLLERMSRRGNPIFFPRCLGTLTKTGSKDVDGLISNIENGIYIFDMLMGIHTANFISGDFSIVAPLGYKIENGEITHPIDSVSVAGNLYKSFNQIITIGNDLKLTDIGKIPSLVFDGFTISG